MLFVIANALQDVLKVCQLMSKYTQFSIIVHGAFNILALDLIPRYQ